MHNHRGDRVSCSYYKNHGQEKSWAYDKFPGNSSNIHHGFEHDCGNSMPFGNAAEMIPYWNFDSFGSDRALDYNHLTRNCQYDPEVPIDYSLVPSNDMKVIGGHRIQRTPQNLQNCSKFETSPILFNHSANRTSGLEASKIFQGTSCSQFFYGNSNPSGSLSHGPPSSLSNHMKDLSFSSNEDFHNSTKSPNGSYSSKVIEEEGKKEEKKTEVSDKPSMKFPWMKSTKSHHYEWKAQWQQGSFYLIIVSSRIVFPPQ